MVLHLELGTGNFEQRTLMNTPRLGFDVTITGYRGLGDFAIE
jgi:hypothetical protein